MKIIIANLSANYNGRGLTELPPGKRMLMIKADGTVLIMNDKGFRPINYMTTITQTKEEKRDGETHLLFSNKKEKLEIILHEVFKEETINIDTDDPPIKREQTENELQSYISDNLDKFDTNFKFISREYETGFGPVDILAIDRSTNSTLAIEVKRNATINSVYQVLRYKDSLSSQFNNVEAILIALSYNDTALELAKEREVRCITVSKNWSDSIDDSKSDKEASDSLTLFDLTS